MVLYIDFEWETEPLKMALSKNFTLPEKCKNHRSAPTVQCWSDSFFDPELFGSSLISQKGLAWTASGPAPGPPRAPEASSPPIPAVNVQVYFKWRREESNKKEKQKNKKKKETYRMKITLPLFLQKNVFFRKNLSLLIISLFLCVFLIWMQLYVFFTLILL